MTPLVACLLIIWLFGGYAPEPGETPASPLRTLGWITSATAKRSTKLTNQ
jgi:hypothetical protein